MKQPFTHFDLTRQHLGEAGHYVPPKARDSAEIERRKQLPAGTLLAEQQQKGIKIARNILKNVEAGESMAFTTKLLGMAVMNASWYTFAQGAPDVMRRRLILPKMADLETEWRPSIHDLRTETLASLALAEEHAGAYTGAIAGNRLSKNRVQQFGRYMGNISLKLAVIDSGLYVPGGNAWEVQKAVRGSALGLLEDARTFDSTLLEHPSVAQLADPDSPLGIFWRKQAPQSAYEAYEQAIAA